MTTLAAACTHAKAREAGSCSRCGDYLCERCRTWRAERAYCAACVARQGDRPSRRASLALLFATIGVCLLVPAVPALYLSLVELRAIDRGEAPSSGRPYAQLARGLALFELALLLIVVMRSVYGRL
jgi:hypothetical protein